jgi:hypothetical protein
VRSYGNYRMNNCMFVRIVKHTSYYWPQGTKEAKMKRATRNFGSLSKVYTCIPEDTRILVEFLKIVPFCVLHSGVPAVIFGATVFRRNAILLYRNLQSKFDIRIWLVRRPYFGWLDGWFLGCTVACYKLHRSFRPEWDDRTIIWRKWQHRM